MNDQEPIDAVIKEQSIHYNLPSGDVTVWLSLSLSKNSTKMH